MLSVRHITHKLRSQSLNEDPNYVNKSDLDRDSGTESDDELDSATTTTNTNTVDKMEPELVDASTSFRRRDRTRSESGKENSAASPSSTSSGGSGTVRMLRRSVDRTAGLREHQSCSDATALAFAVASLSAADIGEDIGAYRSNHPRPAVMVVVPDSPVEFCTTDSALPSDFDYGGWSLDQHSSEEELECINGPEQLVTMMMMSSVPSVSPKSVGRTTNSTALCRFGPSSFDPPSDSKDVVSSSGHQQRRVKTPRQGPEKRKWAQVSPRRITGVATLSGANVKTVESVRGMKSRPHSAVFFHQFPAAVTAVGCRTPQPSSSWSSSSSSMLKQQRSNSSAALDCSNNYSASSDDEVQALVGGNLSQDSPLPLEFRTSPPAGAHRSYPTRSLSPPPKLFLADRDEMKHECCTTGHQSAITATDLSLVNSLTSLPTSGSTTGSTVSASAAGSPRKRHHRHHHAHHRSQQQHQQHQHPVQRPCLDFEKMQQMKNRSVSTWRHDGELSLFCW